MNLEGHCSSLRSQEEAHDAIPNPEVECIGECIVSNREAGHLGFS